ncbi:MAG: hypothetical protein ABW321_33235 [Polyangiales bacterium]
MTHHRWPLPLAAAVLLGPACAADEPRIAQQWSPLSATDMFEGQPLQTWAVAWGRWWYAQTSCELVDRDPDGARCGEHQDPESPVFFLAGGDPGTTRTRCEVPADKAIVVPLAAFLTDNAGAAPSELRTDTELRVHAERVRTSMNQLELSVDGTDVESLENYAIGPTRFAYTLPPEPNWYSCNGVSGVTGHVDPAFIAGYFVVLPRPTAGRHDLVFGGVAHVGEDRAETNHVETTLTVRAADD